MPESTAFLAGSDYWRLSRLYFLYFSLIGVIISFFNLFLDEIGFDAVEIGILSSMLMVTRIFAPAVWGWLADRSGRRVEVIRLGCFLALVSFSGLLLRQDFGWVLMVTILYSTFWNAVLPQFEVLTLNRLGANAARYGRVRLWGSVGFIVAVFAGGMLFDTVSIVFVPWLMLSLLAAIAISTVGLKDVPVGAKRQDAAGLADILRKPVVLGFFVCCFLMLLSHGPYYTFFSLYLQDHGYSRTAIGLLWSIGVVAEILLFMVAHRFLPVLGLRRVIIASLALAALRWLLTGFCVDSLFMLTCVQLLHAATYGAFHSAGILLVGNCFGQSHQGQGQALFSAVSFGAGSALGAWLSGLAWKAYPAGCFVIASCVALLACVVAWIWIRGPETIVESSHEPVQRAIEPR